MEGRKEGRNGCMNEGRKAARKKGSKEEREVGMKGGVTKRMEEKEDNLNAG